VLAHSLVCLLVGPSVHVLVCLLVVLSVHVSGLQDFFGVCFGGACVYGSDIWQ